MLNELHDSKDANKNMVALDPGCMSYILEAGAATVGGADSCAYLTELCHSPRWRG